MSTRRPIQVLVYPVRYRDAAWEFLLLKRVENRGGFWQGVTGAPENGEGIIDGARRELLEETAYDPKLLIQTDFSYTIDVKDVNGSVYPPDIESIPEYVFIARIDVNIDPPLTQLNTLTGNGVVLRRHWISCIGKKTKKRSHAYNPCLEIYRKRRGGRGLSP